MELSLITYLDAKNKNLDNIKSILEVQKIAKFEFILIADNLNQTAFKKLLDLENNFKTNDFKIIFNEKKQGEIQGIFDAVKISNKTFTLIQPNFSSYKKNFVEDVSHLLKSKNIADIIEFRPDIEGLTHWNPKLRFNFETLESIFENEKIAEVLVYAFPFIFNKIFRKEILLKAFENKNLSENTSIFELFYYILPFAKTYMTFNKELSKESINKSHFNSYLVFFKTWKKLENFYNSSHQNLIQELIYAKFFCLQVLIPGFLGHINRKKIISLSYNFIDKANSQLNSNYYEKLKSIHEAEFKNLAVNSKYMMLKNSEVEFLEKVTPKSKWVKILKNFE
ncbi:hypothetical protein [[Mycoplasma] mobile]|uniref:Expressed protein n=1 Tax=Mycoplasma mobile (strain ATCC 43663 / 163K / NCTC 11711) TaxID=267748 RepID=Q6KHF1_MYCM1|nr:hypothetical protein [[Mycoplasma] mobile]AAT27979.1 expressed protein [Mycoplasma mobile 163K]